VLGINLPGQDADESEALLATRVQVAVGDPLDRSPLVNDWFNVLRFSDRTLQHAYLPFLSRADRALLSGRQNSCPIIICQDKRAAWKYLAEGTLMLLA
jgi:hypothetical protein